MTRPYAEVIGDPILHSKSPIIHNFWLEKLGIDAEYRACHVLPEELGDYFTQRRQDAKWLGCNVTIPHKVNAKLFADAFDDEVLETGAANTIYRDNLALRAANTDVAGILAALPLGFLDSGLGVCILGTGGAARAALAACKRRNVSLVLLSARDSDAAEMLLNEFEMGGCFRQIDDAHNIQTADVIINSTPLGMDGKPEMPKTVLDLIANPMSGAAVLDMVYAPVETPFLKAAAAGGCRTVSGLEMLIGQAAAAFGLFFGQLAPREHDAELRELLTR